jgi:hypothetical protein
MQDNRLDPAFAEALSEIERDFFRSGDELEDSAPFETWENLDSRIVQPANDEDEWEWAIAIARARTRAKTAA